MRPQCARRYRIEERNIKVDNPICSVSLTIGDDDDNKMADPTAGNATATVHCILLARNVLCCIFIQRCEGRTALQWTLAVMAFETGVVLRLNG